MRLGLVKDGYDFHCEPCGLVWRHRYGA